MFDAAVIIFTSSIYPINPSSVPHPPIETAACFVGITPKVIITRIWNILYTIEWFKVSVENNKLSVCHCRLQSDQIFQIKIATVGGQSRK